MQRASISGCRVNPFARCPDNGWNGQTIQGQGKAGSPAFPSCKARCMTEFRVPCILSAKDSMPQKENWLSSVCRRLVESAYLRGVAALASGEVIAQTLSMAAAPILTRLYTPGDFAALAVFLAVISTLSPGVCGCYEVAIVVANKRSYANRLLGVAIWFSGLVSALLAVVLVVFYAPVTELIQGGSVGKWMFVTPVALFAVGIGTAFRYYANRHRKYGWISCITVARILLTLSVSISLGVAGWKPDGLLMAHTLSMGFAAACFLFLFRREIRFRHFRLDRSKWLTMSKFRKFPLYNASTNMINALTYSLPVFFLSRYQPEEVVGCYALIVKVTSSPIGFISYSISEVHLKKVSDLVREGGDVMGYLLRITGLLSCIVFVPLVFVLGWGAEAFRFAFGEAWEMGGDLLVILFPAIAVQFVVSTVSMTLSATGHLRSLGFWQILSMGVHFTMFWFCAPILAPKQLFLAMAVTTVAMYFLYFILILRAARNPVRMG